MQSLEKSRIRLFVNWLQARFQVFAPVKMRTKKDTAFKAVKKESELDLDSKPIFSQKSLFFPSHQEMLEFDERGTVIESKKGENRAKKVLFGVRACDLHALLRMDALFLREPRDPYFEKARSNLVIFGLKCSSAWENCFCESVGASELVGHDVEMWEAGGRYFFEGKTIAGKKLLREFGGFEEVEGVKKPGKRSLCKRSVEVGKVDFNKIDWKKWGDICFACSNCVMVCPSCTCFDVSDDLNLDLKSGKRKRTWSSCYMIEFASVSNFCFRPLKSERFKQFVMHKWNYFKKEFGAHMCTGCGRCIDYCPARIDFIEALKEGLR